jgi:glycosyltransferase involved in cell wall biosynthesis
MISVALCIYNGARFLPEQLDSIAAQTRPVDELVVCDDGSTDNSLEIIRQFSETVPFPVHIYQNDRQLGSTKNFEKCLQLCRGDIIFLSDQDDWWYPEKVAILTRYFAENETMEAVFSDGDLIDGDSQPLESRIWDAIQFDAVARQQWAIGEGYQILFRGYVVTGATLAIRARALPRLLPFPDGHKTMIHDGWIALLLALTNQIGFVNEPLIRYRQHADQQVGFGGSAQPVTMSDRLNRPRTDKLALIGEEGQRLAIMHRLLQERSGLPADKLDELARRMRHFEIRQRLPDNRLLRLWPVLAELAAGHYYDRQRHWWKTVLGDLLE